MKPQTFISLFLSILFAVQPLTGLGMETDQYHLPPVPLVDIGDEVSQYIEDNLHTAVANVNADIAKHETCLTERSEKRTGCANNEAETRKLAYLRSNDALADALYKLLGDGTIFTANIGKWMNSHKFNAT